MIDLQKVFEDAVCSGDAAPVGDVVAPGPGIGANDVLGHCDHKSDGYLGGSGPEGCFHVPSKCKVPFRRDICNGGSKKKKKKTPYEVGMKVVTDAELNRDTILKFHKMSELSIRNYVMSNFGGPGSELTDACYIAAVCFYPPTGDLFIKVVDAGSNKTFFCVADFDPKALKLVPPKGNNPKFADLMTATEAKKEFENILHMQGNLPSNKGSEDMKLWVIWGDIN